MTGTGRWKNPKERKDERTQVSIQINATMP